MALLLLLLLLLLLSPSSTAADPISKICKGDTYAANSPFGSNLNLLLASLSLSSTNSSFSNLSKGSTLDRAYGLFLCRGDISPSQCSACVHTAIQDAPQICPSSKQATVWYDACELRYSDESFYSFGNDQYVLYPQGPNASNPDLFSKNERALMSNLSYQAAYNSGSLMFATGEVSVNGSGRQQAIYGLVQCTRDLSADMCSRCLGELVAFFQCCDSQTEGGILGKSCSFRYGVSKFFEGSPKISVSGLLPPPPPAPLLSRLPSSVPTEEDDGKVKKRSSSSTVLVIIIPSAASLVLILSICICFWRRRSRKKFSRLAKLEKISCVESLLLELSTIKAATADFSPVNKLGEGGFGSVYKGILPDGQEIAAKRLSKSSSQGIGELKNELVLVAKLQHKNLIRLLGVCLEKEEKLLVYEYVPNRSLDTFLFDPIQQKQLNWEMRFKIIGGIAQGLHYLHEESHVTVIHRDLKASNILLDADMTPKISDFGLCKLFGCEEKEYTTRRVVGTLGYMAPEYIRRGQFSMKSDVYSFGVLLLEIVTGRKRSKFLHSGNYSDLLNYTREHWINGRGRALEILDPSVNENFSENEVLICILIGLLCTQEVPAERPLMSSVLLMLNSPSVTLPAPSQPPSDGGTSASEISEQRSDLAYIPSSCNNASISVLEPR